MNQELLLQIAAGGAALACLLAGVALVVVLARPSGWQGMRVLLEQAQAGARAEADGLRREIVGSERALSAIMSDLRSRSVEAQSAMQQTLDAKLQEISTTSATSLAAIQKSVDERLSEAVQKQMEGSFQRVVEQFAAVQKAIGDVQAVTAQIGDLRRIFSNVKTRGGWGETQLRALLDDVLPPGSYRMNVKLREGSDEMVEFAIAMPVRGEDRPWLAMDAKFPLEDYERLLNAAEMCDADAERSARRGLEARLRLEARKIAEKYILPPHTVEFAVLYLPTDGLYAEVARIPGLIDEIGRAHRVLVLGPALAPALLRTIQLGFVTMALEHKAAEVRKLLGATRGEMVKMDVLLERLGKQASQFGSTIEQARVRTRAVGRKLREVEQVGPEEAQALLGEEFQTADEWALEQPKLD
jgi:DNA recombination protein RmuC